jgi:hypothetical protein
MPKNSRNNMNVKKRSTPANIYDYYAHKLYEI